MENKRIRTTILLERLDSAKSHRTYIARNKCYFVEKSLPAFLLEKCAEKGVVQEHAVLNAHIDRTYGHQIFRGARNPSRDKLLQLALAIPLTLEETQHMLLLADKRQLHPKIMRDSVIIFCLKKGLPLSDAEEMIDDLSLSPLEKSNP